MATVSPPHTIMKKLPAGITNLAVSTTRRDVVYATIEVDVTDPFTEIRYHYSIDIRAASGYRISVNSHRVTSPDIEISSVDPHPHMDSSQLCLDARLTIQIDRLLDAQRYAAAAVLIREALLNVREDHCRRYPAGRCVECGTISLKSNMYYCEACTGVYPNYTCLSCRPPQLSKWCKDCRIPCTNCASVTIKDFTAHCYSCGKTTCHRCGTKCVSCWRLLCRDCCVQFSPGGAYCPLCAGARRCEVCGSLKASRQRCYVCHVSETWRAPEWIKHYSQIHSQLLKKSLARFRY